VFRGGSRAAPGTCRATRRLGRRIGASLLAMSSLVIVGPQTPAHAHVELLSSSPESGAEVPVTLERVTLVFGEDLFPVGSDISVRGPDDVEVTTDDPTAFGAELEAPLALTGSGRHLLSYRAVGQDGHVITGGLWFTVAAEGLPLPTAAAAPQARIHNTSALDRSEGEQLQPHVTAATWLVGVSLGLGGLVVLVLTARRTRVAVRPRRDHGGTPRARNGS
jgi:copper resistance protein C